MRTGTLIISAGLIAGAAGALWWASTRADAPSAPTTQTTTERTPVNPEKPAAAPLARRSADWFRAPPNPKKALSDLGSIEPTTLPAPSRYRIAEELTTLDARSPKEAEWLRNNGYPTRSELEDIANLSEADLASRSAQGDLAAQALLAQKQLNAKQVLAGYANLEDAGTRGSIYALTVLAERQAAVGNQIESIAWFQVAAMRGDTRAAERMLQFGWQNLTPFTVASAQHYAMRYYANLADARAAAGLPMFVNEPRPGFDEDRPKLQTQVGIYDRTPLATP